MIARPGLAYEQSIRASFGLGEDGKTDGGGVPRDLFDKALIFKLSQSYLAGIPLWLQKTVLVVGVALARRLACDSVRSSASTMALLLLVDPNSEPLSLRQLC